MAKRNIRLGLIFGINEGWIAGTYYIMNLVEALKLLPRELQPHIVFLSNESSKQTIKALGYPSYSIKNPQKRKRNLWEAAINKPFVWLTGKDKITKMLSDRHIHALYPANLMPEFQHISNKIFWIPDFQHHHYPQYFSEQEIQARTSTFTKIAQKTNATLVLSSQAAKADFQQFYPDAQVAVEVLPFAVTHPPYKHLDIQSLKNKYHISKPYYIVTNQFWQHKNHWVVLQAIKHIKAANKHLDFQFVFTGKADDYRAPGFYSELIDYVKQHHLDEDISFVGFIERKEQLALMKHALTVVQPSLFEGWSTVVEDAKAMNQWLILSDIPVHREQNPANGWFFPPTDGKKLAEQLTQFYNQKPKAIPTDYRQNRYMMGEKFFRIIRNSMHNPSHA